jgi:hypothetical protein
MERLGSETGVRIANQFAFQTARVRGKFSVNAERGRWDEFVWGKSRRCGKKKLMLGLAGHELLVISSCSGAAAQSDRVQDYSGMLKE